MRHDSSGRRRQISEGRSKILYEGPEAGTLVLYFKDSRAMFDRSGTESNVNGKGILNNCISEMAFQRLADIGIANHFLRRLDRREQLVQALDIIPLEVVVRNRAAGRLSERLGIEEGTKLDRPLVEWTYKKSADERPLVSEEHILSFGWASTSELEDMLAMAVRVNDFLSGLFAGINLTLVDTRLEFGRLFHSDDSSQIVLADEISPDSCRLWNLKSGERYDASEEQNLQTVAHQSIARKLGVMPEDDQSGAKVTPFMRK